MDSGVAHGRCVIADSPTRWGQAIAWRRLHGSIEPRKRP